MRAISITQPWASLVALGLKRIETRSWGTNFRGIIAIHATKHMNAVAGQLHVLLHMVDILPEYIPLGSIIAVATVREVYPTRLTPKDLPESERMFGDFGPGRFAWLLDNVHALCPQYVCAGHLGLWQVPDNLVRLIQQQIPHANPNLRS